MPTKITDIIVRDIRFPTLTALSFQVARHGVTENSRQKAQGSKQQAVDEPLADDKWR